MKEKTYQKEIGPHLRIKNTTSKMMTNLLIALLPIILFAWYKNGLLPYLSGKATFYGMIYPILMMLTTTITAVLTELSYAKFIRKEKDLKNVWKTTFSIFPGLFLALILPYNTPLLILVFGSLCATLIGKLLFGGFGNNVFNPALIGRLFVIATYALVIANHGGYFSPGDLDTISHATPLTNVGLVGGIGTYETLVAPYGTLWNFFFGTIPGSLGETSAFLCFLGFFYLTLTKTIKWRIPVAYLGTFFVITSVIGGLNGLGIWYPLFQLLSGGLLFGAVFMATDPVTSPTTPMGQLCFGIGLAVLTVVARYLTPYPEGVLTSILVMNMFVFLLDRFGSKIRFHMKKLWIPVGIILVIIISLSLSIGLSYHHETTADQNFKVLGQEELENKNTYTVTYQGYSGLIKAYIVINQDRVEEFKILECNDSFYQMIKDKNYIDSLVKGQNELENVDTVSGATVTSNALKKLLQATISYHKKGNHGTIAPPPTPVPPKEFEVISQIKTELGSIYTVTEKSFGGFLKLEIEIENHIAKRMTILEYQDTYLQTVLDRNYIDQLLNQQQMLESVDTVSGATITSSALKSALKHTLEQDAVNNEG